MTERKLSMGKFISKSPTLAHQTMFVEESPEKGCQRLEETVIRMRYCLKKTKKHNDDLHRKLNQINQQVLNLREEGKRLRRENENLGFENKKAESENQKLKQKIIELHHRQIKNNKFERDFEELKNKEQNQNSRIKQFEQIVKNLKEYIIQKQILVDQLSKQILELHENQKSLPKKEQIDYGQEIHFMKEDIKNLLVKNQKRAEIQEKYSNQMSSMEDYEDKPAQFYNGIEKIENLRERIGRVENEKGLMEKELSDGKKTVKALKERLIKSLEQYEELSGKHHTAMKSNIELQRDMERELFDLNLSVKANMKEELKTTGSFSPRMTMPTSLKYID